jgi:hypothetical protein
MWGQIHQDTEEEFPASKHQFLKSVHSTSLLYFSSVSDVLIILSLWIDLKKIGLRLHLKVQDLDRSVWKRYVYTAINTELIWLKYLCNCKHKQLTVYLWLLPAFWPYCHLIYLSPNRINQILQWQIYMTSFLFLDTMWDMSETKQKGKNYSTRIKFCFHRPKSLGKK